MLLETTRFGKVEVPETEVIQFERGIIGFPQATSFTLIPHGSSGLIAWLQSTCIPGLAFPVASAHALGDGYPDVDAVAAAEKVGLKTTKQGMALLVVLCAPPDEPATVNLLAPLVVDSQTRRGGQVFLEGSRFTTRELFVVQPSQEGGHASALPEAAKPPSARPAR